MEPIVFANCFAPPLDSVSVVVVSAPVSVALVVLCVVVYDCIADRRLAHISLRLDLRPPLADAIGRRTC